MAEKLKGDTFTIGFQGQGARLAGEPTQPRNYFTGYRSRYSHSQGIPRVEADWRVNRTTKQAIVMQTKSGLKLFGN